jgi:hypothetical protein
MADDPGYRYNARAYSYVDHQGRFLSRTQVRDTLDNALANNGKVVRELTQQLRDGRISIADWQTGMAREIKNVHLYSIAAARGGWAQMTPTAYERAGQSVEVQYRYLRGFAEQIASGAQPLNGRALERAAMYSEAGRNTFHHVEREEMEVRGMTEERSIRHPADSCEECTEQEEMGWQPIGEAVPIGERQCLTKCRCTMDYR